MNWFCRSEDSGRLSGTRSHTLSNSTHIYGANISHIREIDELIVFIIAVGAREEIGVSWKVDLVVVTQVDRRYRQQEHGDGEEAAADGAEDVGIFAVCVCMRSGVPSRGRSLNFVIF